MAEEKFISKHTSAEIEAMLDKVKQDMQTIQYSQSEINTLLTKIDNMSQPTKTSDLNNDSGFITDTVNNLINYYLKTETYSKTEINALINQQASGGFLLVNELPTTDISTNHIYLVPSTTSKAKNIKDEYINLDGTSEGWELIGDTKINLSDYVTLTALNAALINYVSTTSFQNTLTSYYTKTEVDNLISQIDIGVGGGYAPIGTIIQYMGITAPQDYLVCDGTAYNITDYPQLANFFTVQFGAANHFGGNGTTTFAVPDLRGEFLRGTGTNSHVNQGSGASVGVHQDGTLSPYIFHEPFTDDGSLYASGNSFLQPSNTDKTIADTSGIRWYTKTAKQTLSSNLNYTSRPTNTSVLYCIKAVVEEAYSSNEKVPGNSLIDRWLRFDPENKHGVIIKAGTNIKLPNGSIKSYATDTHIDLSSYITQGGTDYYLYIDDAGDISAYTSYQSTGNKIGRLHTLCVDVGVNVTMTAPAPASSGYTTNTDYLIKSYRQDKDPDFYAFYNKKVKSVTTQTQYDVVTLDHPLSGFQAGDILPESVFCLNWYPDTLFEDGMVYDKDTNQVIDIYLQSGTGHNTRSKYNQTHTVSRQPYNHAEDMRMVGKKLLYDNEFTSAAIGSNEKTSISGAADAGTVGGHKDTNNRRMISAIGCEEMCGYLWQWLQETSSAGGNGWITTDQNASFGQEYGDPYVLYAGGSWADGASCGSRSRSSNDRRSCVFDGCGGRGSGRILTK